MRSWATQATIDRMVTGDRCEVKGCYEVAVWVISFSEDRWHLCPKHTRMRMRETNRWAEAFGVKPRQKTRAVKA